MLNERRVLGIIPARAGSKGLPGKNYKDLMSNPLVNWSIDASCYSNIIDTTVVTSNCEEVLLRARSHPMHSKWAYWGVREDETSNLKFKLYSLERPDKLCTDEASTEPVMIHALDEMEEELGEKFGYVVLLQPTSPARPKNLIDRCLTAMQKGGHDSLMTVSSHTPFFWTIKNGKAIPNYDPNNRPRRQDIPDEDIMYHDNGNIYVVDADKLRSMGRIGENPMLFETTHFESLQIDTEEDFSALEALAVRYGGLL